MKHKTEQVYDDEIAPLMVQIIKICKRDGIPMMASFGMKDENGEAIGCSTLLAGSPEADDGLNGYRNRFGLGIGIARGHSGFDTAAGLMITRHHKPKTEDTEAG